MRRIIGGKSNLHPLSGKQFKTLSKRFAEIISPVLKENLYFVTEGIHGGLADSTGKPIVKEGSAPNGNGDFFFWHELVGMSPIPGQKVFSTWVNRPVLENHIPEQRRGVVVDCFPIEHRYSLDMLDAVSRREHPTLARKIEAGEITDTSMGVIIGWSECSVCGGHFHDTDEWCDHLRLYKGGVVPTTSQPVFEISHELIGIEDSIISSGQGADTDAKVREVLSQKSESDEKMSRTVSAIKGLLNDHGISLQEFTEFLSFVKNG